MSEHDQQCAVVQWFRLKYRNHRIISYPGGQWIASGTRPNGKFALIAKYKREGWTVGVSDLFIPVSRGGFHGLWLEMKNRGKKNSSLSDEQKKWATDMNAEDYMAKWAAGFDEAKIIIEGYMVLPLYQR